MTAAIEDFDYIRRQWALIKSQTVGGYCAAAAGAETLKCWCRNVGINSTDAPCPPKPQERHAPSAPDQPRALPLVTPVPWFPEARR